MSYALIDNASLTAVERAVGRVVVKNPDTINGDLVAFENLIQAILFYDDLICIDNYKEEHRDSRIKNFDFIRFLAPNSYGLDQVDALSKKKARLIKPEIRGGEFADDDFRELVDLLKLNMVCTWDMRSSVYYLTMKMLGQPNTPEYEKYSELSSAIFNELSDAGSTKGYWSTNATLISSKGHVHTSEEFQKQVNGLGGVTRPLEMFIASLNWLAFKSIYYSIAAKHLRADSFIHPIRHAYQLHWMKKTGAFGHDFSAKVLSSLSQKISTSISEVVDHGRAATVSMDIPIFSAWLAQESGGIQNSIGAALEIKKSDHFTVARETLREIKIAYDESGLAKGNAKITKLLSELDKISGDLKRTYGVPSPQGIQGSFLIKTINSLTSPFGIPAIPEKEFALSTPDFMKSNQSKAFSTIFKDIANELTSIERLGGHRDLLASQFQIDDEYYTAPKTENPKFRTASSGWKLPM
ncbi:hypothetical protein [Stutzerimonas nitrititolerans]|uniref:hypothetical protein n=1 Tax=Stutzerimonas nitrititolerans TaxID=2482751 RepID=UPI002898281C|nr:hypothetical protein [Stutzerimonas nitrititolerans]